MLNRKTNITINEIPAITVHYVNQEFEIIVRLNVHTSNK